MMMPEIPLLHYVVNSEHIRHNVYPGSKKKYGDACWRVVCS